MFRPASPPLPWATVVLALLLALSAVLPGASAHGHDNDAGSGADAPSDCDAADTVSEVTWYGHLDPGVGDWGDCYRVNVPPDKGVRVRLDASTTWTYFLLKDVDGHDYESTNYVGDPVTLDLIPHAGAVYVSVQHGYAESAYQLDVTFVDLVDVAVVDVTVDPPATGPVEGVSAEGARPVRVTVRNDAAVDAAKVTVDVTAHQEGKTRWVGTRVVDVAAGGARTLEFAWDDTGQLGEVTLRATLSTAWDRGAGDNVATTGAEATTDRTDLPAADLLVNKVRVGEWVGRGAGLDAHTTYDGARFVAGVDARVFVQVHRPISVLVDEERQVRILQVDRHAPAVCVLVACVP